LKTKIKIVFITVNYFWDLKESEILAEKIKVLSIVEPYVGKYFSTDYIKRKILKQSEEEISAINKEMEKELQQARQEQMSMMAQQALQGGQQQGEEMENE